MKKKVAVPDLPVRIKASFQNWCQHRGIVNKQLFMILEHPNNQIIYVDPKTAEDIMKHLRDKGYIDDSGTVTDHFNPNITPDALAFDRQFFQALPPKINTNFSYELFKEIVFNELKSVCASKSLRSISPVWKKDRSDMAQLHKLGFKIGLTRQVEFDLNVHMDEITDILATLNKRSLPFKLQLDGDSAKIHVNVPIGMLINKRMIYYLDQNPNLHPVLQNLQEGSNLILDSNSKNMLFSSDMIGEVVSRFAGLDIKSRFAAIRHGETQANHEKKFQGWANDEVNALLPGSKEEAKKAGKELANTVKKYGIKHVEFIHSNLTRTRQTAHYAALGLQEALRENGININIETNPDKMKIDSTCIEMRSDKHDNQNKPELLSGVLDTFEQCLGLNEMAAGSATVKYAGMRDTITGTVDRSGGENFLNVMARAIRFVQKVDQDVQASDDPEKLTVVISHAKFLIGMMGVLKPNYKITKERGIFRYEVHRKSIKYNGAPIRDAIVVNKIYDWSQFSKKVPNATANVLFNEAG